MATAKTKNVHTAKSKIASKKASDAEKFAVIQTGGKQYIVKEGERLKVEKIKRQGGNKKISFDKVLLVAVGRGEVKIGNPYVSGAKVEAEIEEEGRAKKITVIRFKSKTRQFKKKGHRQLFSKIKILKIK